MKKPELLSPAGNIECLKAAIIAGCDAVYLGGKNFGARSFASNFSDDEIVEAIKYAHIYGVRVYITVNTLIYENEVAEFIKYIEFIHKNNVDAVIMQDLGMIDLVKQTFPNLEIHASTQMHIHNIEGVKLAKKLGLKRVVLARETNMETIKNIKEEIDMDLEIFIHGALCLSYSGECLMSSLIGGRSGNRGSCTQCCRMKYDLYSNSKKLNEDKYLLSTKDLNTINNIDKLIDIGVDSLKIEGRMKRPEYVYIVTKLYRKAIDSYVKTKKINITNEDIEELKKIFNRKFTKGFLFNETNIVNQYRPNHMGIEIGKVISYKDNFVTIKLNQKINQEDGIRILNEINDVGCTLNKIYLNKKLVNKANENDIISFYIKDKVAKNDVVIKTTDINQLKKINKEIKNNKKIMINVEIICQLNKPIRLIFDDGHNKVQTEKFICEKAIKNKTDEKRIINQINRLKDTPYEINKLKSNIDDNIFVKISDLNEIRREIVNLLNEKRCYKIPYVKEKYNRKVTEYNNKKSLSVEIKNKDDLISIKTNRIYFKQNLNNTIYNLPRVINKYENIKKTVLINELGSLNKYKNVITNFSFNVTNSYTVALLNNIGVKLITLSYELNDFQIEKLIEKYKERYNKKPNLELIISSYPEVMISKFNLLNQFNIENGYIQNEKKDKFYIENNNEYMTIYYSSKIIKNNYNFYYNIGIDSLRVELNDREDLKLIKQIEKELDL